MLQTIDAIKAHMEQNNETDWQSLKAVLPHHLHQSMLEATRYLHKTGYLTREAVRVDGSPNVILRKN